MIKTIMPGWSQSIIVLLIAMLVLLSFSSNVIADNVVTANLLITPSPKVTPGTQLSFKGVIFNNPDFSKPAETKMRCWVIQPDFTRVTESIDINYPNSGKHVTLNFTDKFTIPSNAAHGKIYDFFLVYGIYYPLNVKSSVTVIVRKLQLSSSPKASAMKFAPKMVVKNFSYSSAPLKEGSPVNIFIVFENKGLGKSTSNAKYQIRCDILNGGGPLKKCPVPSGERAFGKEILPGKTHSVSLYGATPAEAGQYKISILFPGTTAKGRPYSIVLNVAQKGDSKFKTVPSQKNKFISPGTKKGFNPQPEPPGRVK